MIDQQKVEVDTVSGGTYTSKGLIEAVKNALEGAVTADNDSGGDYPSEADSGSDGQVADLQAQLAAKEAEVASLKEQVDKERSFRAKVLAAWQQVQIGLENFFSSEADKQLNRDDIEALLADLKASLADSEADQASAGQD